MPKTSKERPGPTLPKAGSRQLVARALDAARRKGQPQTLCNKKHLKSLTGQTAYQKKKKNRTYKKSPRESPTSLATRAALCCVCLFTSLPRMDILNGSTNTHTTTCNTPTSTPTENTNIRAWIAGNDNHNRNTHGDKDLANTLDRQEYNRPSNDARCPITNVINPIDEGYTATFHCHTHAYTDHK